MKHRLLAGALAPALAISAGFSPEAHAQFDLVILSADNQAEYADLETLYTDAGYTVSFENFSGVTPTAQDLTDLESNYDVAMVTRNEVSSSYESQEWNDLGIGLVLLNPFLPRSSQWDWLPDSGGSTGAGSSLTHLNVDNAAHPLLDGVAITDDQVEVFDPASTVRARRDDIDYSTEHNAVAVLSYETGDPPDTRSQLLGWEAGEFYPGSGQVAGARRVLFAMDDTNEAFVPNLTADGEQLFLNMTEWAAVPEPGTVALWIGMGAFGSVLLIRRMRRNRA